MKVDARQIICSFHRDFIPDMNDLYKYFGEFGKVVNKIEIEYDSKSFKNKVHTCNFW